MAPGSVETEHRTAGGAAQRQRGFVPVGAGILHAQRRKDFGFHAADPAEAVLHLLSFGRESGLIAHMAAGTPAAAGKCGAVRILSVRRWNGGHVFHPPEGVALFHLDNAHIGFLAREQAGNKDRHAVMAAYAFHIRTRVFRPHGENIVLLQRNPAFPMFINRRFPAQF